MTHCLHVLLENVKNVGTEFGAPATHKQTQTAVQKVFFKCKHRKYFFCKTLGLHGSKSNSCVCCF